MSVTTTDSKYSVINFVVAIVLFHLITFNKIFQYMIFSRMYLRLKLFPCQFCIFFISVGVATEKRTKIKPEGYSERQKDRNLKHETVINGNESVTCGYNNGQHPTR